MMARLRNPLTVPVSEATPAELAAQAAYHAIS